jgi:hypothetical protein
MPTIPTTIKCIRKQLELGFDSFLFPTFTKQTSYIYTSLAWLHIEPHVKGEQIIFLFLIYHRQIFFICVSISQMCNKHYIKTRFS